MKGFLLCLVLVSYLNVEATADEDVFRGRSNVFFLNSQGEISQN